MANWRSYIDPSIGDGQNTIDGIIANGSTYGLQISDDLSVTGIATVTGDLYVGAKIFDGDNTFGSSGQVLSSDGTDTKWINTGSLTAGAASEVGITAVNSNSNHFITFVDSSSGNENVKVDTNLTYNPSTNAFGNINVDGLHVLGNLRIDGQLKDGDNLFGGAGTVLTSDGTNTKWDNVGNLSAGSAAKLAVSEDDTETDGRLLFSNAAGQSGGNIIKSDNNLTYNASTNTLTVANIIGAVSINDDGNTDAERFITFVNSSSGNNSLKTDSVIKYNPSTNILNLNATASGIKFGPGNATNDDAHIEWLGGSNAGHLRISTSDDNGTEYIQFGDYDLQNRGGTFTQWLRISRSTGTFTGTFSATTFSGSGASLTSLNASNISSGTISAARVPTLNQNTTGSAATLTTARTIGGVSFNGSANINLPGVNQAGNQNTSGNAATATVLATARNFSISGEITASAQSFNGSGNLTLSATVDDNVIDEANLKISNSPQNGFFLKCNTGVSGGLTWSEVSLPTAATLDGTTLASGITASSITSLGTLTGLTVSGNASFGSGSFSISSNVSITGTVNIDNTITLDSKNEDPSHDKGVIIIQPSTSGGRTGINFRSKVNSTSDHGYLWWYDDNNNYANNSTNTENGVLVLGVQNDPSNTTPKDAVAVESSGDIFLNPGTSNDSYGGASGPDFTKGKVYIGREATKYQVWHEGNDGGGSGLDADKLDNQQGTYYRNAGNLNAGTIPDARLSSSSLFVTGMIILWSGAQNAIPTGWVICDGNNSTPDLRNRFVIGAGSGGNYSPNDTGGSSSILLGTANLPSHTHQLGGTVGNRDLGNHNHSFSGSGSSSHSHGFPVGQDDDDNETAINNLTNAASQPGNFSTNNATVNISISGTTGNKNLGNHNHSLPATTGNQGGTMNTAFDNRPPYYALCYIMKT